MAGYRRRDRVDLPLRSSFDGLVSTQFVGISLVIRDAAGPQPVAMFPGKLPRLTNLVHVLHVRRECRERGVAGADQGLIDEVDLPVAEVEPDIAQEPSEAVTVADVSFQIEVATEREHPREVGRGFLAEAFG